MRLCISAAGDAFGSVEQAAQNSLAAGNAFGSVEHAAPFGIVEQVAQNSLAAGDAFGSVEHAAQNLLEAVTRLRLHAGEYRVT
jgi:hypothetical protein